MGAHSIGSQEGALVAAETRSLYERLGGVYAIAWRRIRTAFT